jgi:hypothetical protein
LLFGDGPGSDTTIAEASIALSEGSSKIATRIERLEVGELRMLLIHPQETLKAMTEYNLRWEEQHEYWDNDLARGDTQKASTFTTGNDEDHTAPSALSLEQPSYRWRQSEKVHTSCDVSTPWVELAFKEIATDEFTEGSLLYGIWVVDSEGRIDLTKPPTTYGTSLLYRKKLILGKRTVCAINNFDFPKDQKMRKLAIAAIDLAGNVGGSQELEIDLSFPGTGYSQCASKQGRRMARCLRKIEKTSGPQERQ